MAYSLFLDDERHPPLNQERWMIARSYESAILIIIECGMPAKISFDHDLGVGKSGYDFARWIINRILDKEDTLPENFTYVVHSANPVGAANITGLMDGFLVHLKQVDDDSS